MVACLTRSAICSPSKGTLLHALIERFGADHVMYGSDHPFLPGGLDGTLQVVRDGAARWLALHDGWHGANALKFLGLAEVEGEAGLAEVEGEVGADLASPARRDERDRFVLQSPLSEPGSFARLCNACCTTTKTSRPVRVANERD